MYHISIGPRIEKENVEKLLTLIGEPLAQTEIELLRYLSNNPHRFDRTRKNAVGMAFMILRLQHLNLIHVDEDQDKGGALITLSPYGKELFSADRNLTCQ